MSLVRSNSIQSLNVRLLKTESIWRQDSRVSAPFFFRALLSTLLFLSSTVVVNHSWNFVLSPASKSCRGAAKIANKRSTYFAFRLFQPSLLRTSILSPSFPYYPNRRRHWHASCTFDKLWLLCASRRSLANSGGTKEASSPSVSCWSRSSSCFFVRRGAWPTRLLPRPPSRVAYSRWSYKREN